VRGYSEKTVQTYEVPLRQMLEHHRLEKSGEGWRLDILPLRRKIAADSKRTLSKKLSAIRSFVRYLEEQRKIPISLAGDDSVKAPRTLPKPIEEEYIREVMETAGTTGRLILALSYGLGLRISELAALRWEQFSGEWITITGKGGKSRQLPLPSKLAEYLDAYRESVSPGEYVFEKNGTPLNVSQLRYRIQKLFRQHGIRATPHQLRHSFATHLLEHGARISDVSELLGHSSMATTQIYTRLGSAKKLREYMKAHPLAGRKGGKSGKR